MKPEIPSPNATLADLARYLQAKHLCDQANFDDARLSRAKIGRRVELDSRVNIVTLAAFIATMVGGAYWLATWQAGVNEKLDQIPQLVAAGAVRDQRLTAIDAALREIQATARDSQRVLGAADARRRR